MNKTAVSNFDLLDFVEVMEICSHGLRLKNKYPQVLPLACLPHVLKKNALCFPDVYTPSDVLRYREMCIWWEYSRYDVGVSV